MKKKQIIALGLLGLLLLSAHCRKKEIPSAWRDAKIVIDGDSSEWESHLVYNEKNNFSFGVVNDNNALYLCVVTANRDMIRKVVGNGLIVWLNSDGGKHKEFGVKYPMGRANKGRPMGDVMRNSRDLNGGFSDEQMDLNSEELQVLAPKGKQTNLYTLKEARAKGLETQALIKDGIFTYEVKTPLSFDDGIAAIALSTGATVGVGLETPSIDLREMRQKMDPERGSMGGRGGMRGSGGGRGGMGGGRGGGRGGMRGGAGGGMSNRGGMSAPAPIKIWATVNLAQSN